jgi:uncharacterized protein with WD repeat
MTSRTTVAAAIAAEAVDQKDDARFADIDFDSNRKGNDDLIKIAQNRC